MTLFLRNRVLSLIALASTLIVLAVLAYRAPIDAEWLIRYYAIDPALLPRVYGALIVVLLVLVWFEPQIRRELADGSGTALIVFVSAEIVFIASALVTRRPQAERIVAFPGSLWLVIVHSVILCGLALIAVTTTPLQFSTPRMRRYAGFAGLVAVIALLIASIISLGEFMPLDIPDEPWFTSAATHFADTGRLSTPFLASAYGDPDPVMPGYYALMGMWIRLTDSSLVNLRTVPLIVGIITVFLTAFALWRDRRIGRTEIVVGGAVMLTFSAFVRASHNLRPDILLSVYSALVLVGLLAFFESKSIWSVVLMGAAFYVGLEAIPTAAAGFGGIVALVLILQVRSRSDWRYIIAYMVAGGFAIMLYSFGHFWPDVVTNIERLQAFFTFHRLHGAIFQSPLDFIGRLNLILSPAELLALASAFAILFWRGDRPDRIIGGVVLTTLFALPLYIRVSYGYMALFAPFVAYIAARAVRTKIGLVLVAFLFLPALVAPPLLDMARDARDTPNARMLAEADLLTWQIPEGADVAGDDLFWFTLHDNHRFVGWEGVYRYADVNGLTLEQAIDALGIDVIICLETDSDCALVPEELYGPPSEFTISRGRHWVYFRR